ncbi:EAL domain-containing protein [Ruminiclostridium herbifermentans]|uniref:EAL domain-containing protein n=1 Tax=Ruminiclostridium herbifermentans TaxID=2488810 RepID=A0A4U7JL70_9FIRM|nr:EAL domain-containing protein [Ruminiclostridium herbifermentans]QNU68501.1 EAL domain-containing protein [Ruminiclostridium herbifermentans]
MRVKIFSKVLIAAFTVAILVTMMYLFGSYINNQENARVSDKNSSLNRISLFTMAPFETDQNEMSFFTANKEQTISIFIFASILIVIIAAIVYRKKTKIIKEQLLIVNAELASMNSKLQEVYNEINLKRNEVKVIQENLKESEERYTHLALHDVLTGLPNRQALYENASQLFSDLPAKKAALILIDLDNFKYINDTMGHDFGDELIKKASERLLLNMNNKGILYRLGGDEFVILQALNEKEAESLITNILNSFRKEFVIKSCNIHISLSIGLAVYPEHGESISKLMKAADIAMYTSKESGKNRYEIYHDSMNVAFSERMNLEKYLYIAMEKREFELYYQPQLDLNNNSITGLEALIRWKSPELGNVSPMDFIKVAEDTHLIIPLGEWVLIQACEFLSQLHKSGNQNMTMSVNISPIQILQEDFTDKVIKILKYYNIAPMCLELELTETILIESFENVYKKLQMLSDIGIRIALDDFGKGYSSLNYLRQLPIHTLKIDKCFIDNVSFETENKTITRHIISMGKSMGLSVIAEGVEVQGQLDYLKKYNCDKMQGYLFSRPLPKSEIAKLVKAPGLKIKSIQRGA